MIHLFGFVYLTHFYPSNSSLSSFHNSFPISFLTFTYYYLNTLLPPPFLLTWNFILSHLDPLMARPHFVIEAEEAESMAKKSGLSLLQLLPTLVKSAKSLARPPISKFHVGAVGLGSDGRIFFGVNLEFPGVPLNQSVHAEQFLITNAFINKESEILYFAVSSAPCGHCRQFLQEIRGASNIKILITDQEEADGDFKPISEFLPHRFGPHDLLEKTVPLLLEQHHNGLVLKDHNNVGYDNSLSNGEIYDSNLKYSAMEAANESHAPYSGCPSGVALMDSDGKVYKGSYIESAAYNPSLGPVQAALVAYIARGGGNYDRIVAGALVEREGAIVGQEAAARLLLKSVSPQCDLNVFYCESMRGNCQKSC